MSQPEALPSWGQVARQPRYLAGLALAILAAVIFGLLANWQWSRTLTPIPAPPQEFEVAPLADLIQPGGLLPAELINRPVQFTAEIDFANTYIVAGRRQLGRDGESIPGFWLVTNSIPEEPTLNPSPDSEITSSLTLAMFFSANMESLTALRSELAALPAAPSFEVSGVLAAPEGPRPLASPALASLSVAQLVNLYSAETLRSYPAVVIVSESSAKQLSEFLVDSNIALSPELEPIRVRYLEEDFEINWLTAFYAFEWLIFAVIAFYIWWRLVSDARSRALQR